MIIRTDETADIDTATGRMRLHIARPAGEGRFPGVVLYSEIYQVTAPIRRLAATLAGFGYLVAVPEVYHEHEPAGTVLAYDKSGTDRGNDLKFLKPATGHDTDAAAIVAWLQAHADCTGKIGTFGVCLGGHLAFRAALHPAVSAAACFYPTDIHSGTLGKNVGGNNAGGDDTISRLSELKAEVMLVFGRQDPHVPFEGRERLRAALEQAGVRYEYHEVNAQHAFLRDEAPRFDAALAHQAIGWTVALFGRTLR